MGTLRDRIHNHMVDMLYGAFDMLTNQGAPETRAQLVQWVNEKKIPPELLEAYDILDGDRLPPGAPCMAH